MYLRISEAFGWRNDAVRLRVFLVAVIHAAPDRWHRNGPSLCIRL